MVPFAQQCDHCDRRSPEYTTWPTCRLCGDDCCDDCADEDSVRDEEGRVTCVCVRCMGDTNQEG